MSCSCDWEADGESEHISTYRLRCRKPFSCDECGERVERGQTYQRNVFKWEGDLCTDKQCLLCVRVAMCHSRAALRTGFSGSWVSGELRCAVGCCVSDPQYLKRFRKEWKESAVHGPVQSPPHAARSSSPLPSGPVES